MSEEKTSLKELFQVRHDEKTGRLTYMPDALNELLAEFEKRIVLLERVFGRLMQYDLRLDNLEFHSGQPMKPVIQETIMDIKLRLTAVEDMLDVKAPVEVRNDE